MTRFLYAVKEAQYVADISLPRAVIAVVLTYCQHVIALVVCVVRGHDVVDFDPGDPEVGPQPDVQCRRCGRCW